MNKLRAEKAKRWITGTGGALLLLIGLLWVQTPTQAAEASNYTIKFVDNEFRPQAGLDPLLLADAHPSTRWHGLIQLRPEAREIASHELASMGVQLLQYVPDNTWIASFPADYGAVVAHEAVRWVGAYQAAHKIDVVLQDPVLRDSFIVNGGELPLAVRVFADVALETATAAVAAYARGPVSSEPAAQMIRLTIAAHELQNLAQEDVVQYVSADLAPSTQLEGARQAASVDTIHNAPYNLTGNDIDVVVFDAGGVDDTHPDLTGRVINPDSASSNTHATHVGGIVASDGSNSANQGYTALEKKGFAPGVELISYTWSNPIGRHDTAINTYGADLSQNSWGFNNCNYFGMYILYAADFDGVITGDFGRKIPVIFAAGNTHTWCGYDYGSILGGPSSAKNVLTVGATKKDGTVVSYSAYGPTRDGRLKPEIVAVGHNVISTCPGGGYCNYDGTSMAAPAVSGTAALLLEQYRATCTALTGPGGILADPLPATVRNLLIHSATDLNDANNDTTLGPDFASGFGALNAPGAINLLPYFVENSVADGVTDEYVVTITNQSSLRATLVWDDPEAAHNASITLINDLDLEIVSPDGNTVYGPWLLDASTGNEGNPATRPSWSSGGSASRDQRNVVEQVEIDNPTAGDWTIRVIGSNVPNGPQSYSLVNEQLEINSCAGFAGTLSGNQSGADVQLAWSDLDVFDSFQVYRSTSSGFTVGDGNTTLIGTVDGTLYSEGQTINFSDSGIINGTINSYYYAIRGTSAGGATSGLSNEIAKVDFTLSEGQSNSISWNLTSGINDSDALQTHIEANSIPAVNVRFIESWDAGALSYRLFSRSPFTFGLFNVNDAASYRVAVNVPSASSTVWSLVGANNAGAGTRTQQAATAPALYYGQLTGASSGVTHSYVAWVGSAPGAPAEILTEDGFNTTDGVNQGYQNDYWLVNLNNLATPPGNGEQVNLVFGGTSTTPGTLWTHTFNYSQAAENSNQGSVGSEGSTSCPDLTSVSRAGNNNTISFSAPAGTYLIYRSQQSAGAETARSNGRYQFLTSLTTTGSSGQYVDTTAAESWYIVVPADGSNNINGCHSPERGASAPTAIQLGAFAAGSGQSGPLVFIGLLAAALISIGVLLRPLLARAS